MSKRKKSKSQRRQNKKSGYEIVLFVVAVFEAITYADSAFRIIISWIEYLIQLLE